MIIALLIIGLLLCGYSIIRGSDRIGIIKAMVMTVIGYFFSHIILSGGLFWLEQYTIIRTLACCAVFWFIIALIQTRRAGKFDIDFDIRKELFPLIIAVCVLPIVAGKFEFFGLQRDEGVYQTQAICFMYGMTERQIDFEEYYLIEDEVLRELFVDAVSEDRGYGFYNYASKTYLPTVSEDKAISDISGMLHGVPTFSALLALWGSIFGIENMSQINTILFICSIFLIGYICEELKMKRLGTAIALITYSLTPLVVWVVKSSLTETGLIVIWLMYFYLLIKYKENKKILLSAVCIMVHSFYHLSVYAFMPLFVVIYVWLYGLTKNKYAIYSVIFSAATFLAGFWFIYAVCPTYMELNLKPILKMGITIYNAHYIVTAVCLCCILGAVIFLAVEKGRFTFALSGKKVISIETFIYRGIVILTLLGTIYYYFSNKCIPQQLNTLTLVAYCITAGIIIPLVVLFHTSFRTKKWLSEVNTSILLWMFMYCVLVYSLVFRTRIEYFYYYARYLSMFIPLILIMGAKLLDEKREIIGGAICIATLALSVYYDIVMVKGKDASRMEWHTLLAVAELPDENDAVVISQEDFVYYYFPLKAICGVDIYPIGENLEQELKVLEEKYEEVYCITDEYGKLDCDFLVPVMIDEYVYSRDNNTYYGDYTSPYHGNFIPYPTAFYTEDRKVYMLEYNKMESGRAYSVSEKEIMSYGFYDDEGGTKWSSSEDCKTVINLKKADYNISLDIKMLFSMVTFKERVMTISFNGNKVAEINLNEAGTAVPIVICVDEEMVNNGANTIEYNFKLWSPAIECGSPDSRWLGFMLQGITVQESQ